MTQKRRTARIRSNFNMGGLIGEHDPLLDSAFYDNGDFEVITSFSDRRFFIVGRTGSGKSASLRRLETTKPDSVIRIDPETLSMRYLTHNDTIRHLLLLGVKLEPFFRALWKHVFAVSIINHRYKRLNISARLNALEQLKDYLSRDPAKKRALQYIECYEDRFWSEPDERIKEEITKLDNQFRVSIGATAGAGPFQGNIDTGYIRGLSREQIKEFGDRLQPIVDKAQLAHLNDIIVTINDSILDSEQKRVYLIIDDLDKEWVDDGIANLLIRCLFDAVLDIQKIRHLKVLVALRTNIFRQLGYGSHTRSGQEEKFRASSLELGWTRDDLEHLLALRAGAAAAHFEYSGFADLNALLPRNHRHRGHPLQYILDRTCMRPRDAIAYLNCCLRLAAGKDRISWDHILHAEKKYSEDRLMALRDEWKDPYFGIDHVIDQFDKCGQYLGIDDLTKIFERISSIPGTHRDERLDWIDDMFSAYFDDSEDHNDWMTVYGRLLHLLFDISFIGVCDGLRAIYSHDDSPHSPLSSITDDTVFCVHPMFRPQLNITSTN